MRIGIIDSGKGGLAIARHLRKLPNEYIILLDCLYFPYGTKSKEFLLKRSYYLVDYLIKRGVDRIILACNTLSVTVLPFLRSCFSIPIDGVFDYLIPYLIPDNIFMGSYHTCLYVKERYPVDCIFGNELIEAIEKKKPYQGILAKYYNQYKTYQKLILGCTHFLNIEKEEFGIPTIEQAELLLENLK